MRVAVWLGLWAIAAVAVADPLPKGDVKAIDQNKVKGPAEAVEMVTSCFDDFAYPLGDNGYFTSDGKSLYLLATNGILKRREKKGAQAAPPLTRYVLYRMDLETKKSSSELGLSHKEGAHLVTFGEPVTGIQAIVFEGKEKDCLMGKAGLIGVSFKAGSQAVRDSGEFILVPGHKGSVLFDQRKGRLTETDLATFQTRLLAKIPANERPLYYDSGRKTLVTFKSTKKKRGLVRYKMFVTNLEEQKKLGIGERDRVLRDGDKFGFIVTDASKNEVLIRQVPVWTDEERIRTITLTLPAAARVQDSLFIPDFEREYLAVIGKNEKTKRKWGSLLLYDLSGGKLLHKMLAGKGLYYRFAEFSPDGTLFFAEAVSRSGLSRALHVYDFATRKQNEYLLKD